jgi:hypothetical protein
LISFGGNGIGFSGGLTGNLLVFCILHGLNGPVEGLKEVFEIFFEHDDLVTFEIRFPVLFALDHIQKNVTHAVFFDVEEVCSLLALRVRTNRKDLAPDSHTPIP